MKESSYYKAPHYLYGRITADIHKREKRRNRMKFYFSLGLSVFSAGAFYASAVSLYTDLIQSGFIQQASLIFSDSGIVVKYWSDFVSSLLEIMPVAGLLLFLSSIAFALLSLSFLLKYFRRAGFVYLHS